jgi:hypothetical protein
MAKIVIPATSPEDWLRLLPKEGQGQRGESARALARCWQDADGLPKCVHGVLADSQAFPELDLLLAVPQHTVELPGGSSPARGDVWALARSRTGLISLVVKGLAREPFGETLRDWRRDYPAGKRSRLEFLCGMLDLDLPLPDGIRYPLLKWTAMAVIEAIRFHAQHAVFLVHSFSPAQHWVEDYRAFVGLFGVSSEAGGLVSVGDRMGIRLHVGWVSDDAGQPTP